VNTGSGAAGKVPVGTVREEQQQQQQQHSVRRRRRRRQPKSVPARVIRAAARAARSAGFRWRLVEAGVLEANIPSPKKMGWLFPVECGTWLQDRTRRATALWWVRPSSSGNGKKRFEAKVLLVDPHRKSAPQLMSPTAFERMTSRKGWRCFNKSASVVDASSGSEVCRPQDFLRHNSWEESIKRGKAKKI
jgi:hypothetical protein